MSWTAPALLHKVHVLPFKSTFQSSCLLGEALPLLQVRTVHQPSSEPVAPKKQKSFAEANWYAFSNLCSNREYTSKPLGRIASTFRELPLQDSVVPSAAQTESGLSITDEEPGSLFCFGFGYTTLGLANTLKKEGWHVTGTCRSEEKKEALSARGLPAVVFDTDGEIEGLESDGLAALRSATHLVASIPPIADFDEDPALAFHASQIREAASKQLRWVGYLSTTGVYGDWDGAWVDESTKPRPSNQRAAARLRAEEAWLALGREAGTPVHIFRLGGIYGPSRSALDAVRSGRAPSQTQRVRESRRFTSRCHVADIVRVVAASIKRPANSEGRIYNVVDDDPAPRRQVVAYARQLLGVSDESGSEPQVEAASTSRDVATSASGEKDLGSGRVRVAEEPERRHLAGRKEEEKIDVAGSDASSEPLTSKSTLETRVDPVDDGRGKTRGVDEKRVRNDRIKQELVGTLTFPSYEEGLAAIAGGDMQPFD